MTTDNDMNRRPESRLEKALRLGPKTPADPNWKAIKHTGLRPTAPEVKRPAPQQEFFTKPGWGYPRVPIIWHIVGLVLTTALAVYWNYFVR